jgi:uncharacterized protein
MPSAQELKAVNNAPMLVHESRRSQLSFGSHLKQIFAGPNGIRAGWRLLLFVVLVVGLLASFVLIRSGGIQGFKEAQKHSSHIVVTPLLMGTVEGIAFLLISFATFVMSKLERRNFSDYGLPLSRAFGKEFWIGALSGFLALSGTLLAMFLLHGYRITGLALHGAAILWSILGWGIATTMVGLFEEFLCRGYAQYTLASGIGFWPAALAISFLFGFGHAFNANETTVGAISAGLFGLLFCLVLRRTGNLWIPIGFHAAWDAGQAFYGVPDSGITPYHSVFSSTLNGPPWLSGGTVGPEASIFCPIALVIVGLILSRCYRENRYPVQ